MKNLHLGFKSVIKGFNTIFFDKYTSYMLLGSSIGQAASGNWLGGLLSLGLATVSFKQTIMDFWREINTTHEDKRRIQLEAASIELELDGQINIVFKNEDGKVVCREDLGGELVLQVLLANIQSACNKLEETNAKATET